MWRDTLVLYPLACSQLTRRGRRRETSTHTPVVAVVERWWNGGGTVVERWWNGGGTVVERWWNGGGTVVERWWNGGGTVEIK